VNPVEVKRGLYNPEGVGYLLNFNPFRVGLYEPFSSVGFTYGYSYLSLSGLT
jgi:hypothetical protein